MSFTVRPVREERKSSKRIRKYVLIGTSLLEAGVHLYRSMMKEHEEEVKQEHRVRFLKRTVTILLSGLLILILLIGTLKILVRLKAISLDNMVSAVSATLPKDDHGFTNVLLLGVGDDDHDGVDLTDTIMVLSLDPDKTKGAVMLSLPRDIDLLGTEKMGKGRINSLYRDYKTSLIRHGTERRQASTEALKQFAAEIGTLIGLEIHGVIKLNFSGFEKAIDALGGIDVIVPEDIVDTEYPGPNYTYETFSIAKGPQHLDGATALKYARSRHSTSDFSRSGRQQQIITAASEKAKKMGIVTNVSKITEIMSIVASNMETTFGTRELLGLVQMGKKIDQKKMVNMQLSDQSGLFDGYAGRGGFLYSPPREQFDGAAVLLPVSIPEFPVTWKQVQTLGKLLFLNREAFVHPPTVMILNAGSKEGSARKLGGELIRYGFDVIKTRNYSKSPNPSFDHSSIAVNPSPSDDAKDAVVVAGRLERARYSLLLLSKILGVKQSETPDPTSFGDEQPDLVIVLGKDFHYTPLQDLVR